MNNAEGEVVKGVGWDFFPGRTGIGPSGPLQKALEEAGITIVPPFD
jgi:hypothetical protein